VPDLSSVTEAPTSSDAGALAGLADQVLGSLDGIPGSAEGVVDDVVDAFATRPLGVACRPVHPGRSIGGLYMSAVDEDVSTASSGCLSQFRPAIRMERVVAELR
jgi:hypothetical protein